MTSENGNICDGFVSSITREQFNLIILCNFFGQKEIDNNRTCLANLIMTEIDYIFERTKGVCFMEHIIEQLVEGKYNFNVIVCQLFNLILHSVFEDFEI